MTQYISPNDVLLDVLALESASGKPLDCSHRRVAGALSVLVRLFGPDWLDSHILTAAANSGSFIQPAGTAFDQFKMGDRVVTLAEHLVNLQEVDGFDCCLEELRTDKIEPSFAKLVAAGMLQKRSIPFRFVVPSQQLGRDYDAEAIIGAAAVPIEMKAKVEGNALSARSIRNSLRRARKQLPKATPNIVFLRVPESWALTEPGRLEIMSAVLKEFTDSGSIGVVVVHYERWYNPPEQPEAGERRHRLLIVRNGEAHVDLAALEDALLAIPEDYEEIPWLTFDRLLCTSLDPAASSRRESARPQTSSRFPEMSDLTMIGPVQLQYAHLCRKDIRNPEGSTWQGIRQHFRLEDGAESLPAECDLVIGLRGLGRFREGKHTLRVLFCKEGQGGLAPFHEENIDFGRVGGRDSPVIAGQTLNVGGLKIDGPGIYHFDFLLENQWVGRLPFVISYGQAVAGRVNRGPLRTRPVDLEFGHIVRGIDPPSSNDPEYAFTLKGVGDGFGIREASPFRLLSTQLIIGLSASGDTPTAHRLSVHFQDAQGNSLSTPTEETVSLQPFLPGTLFAMRGFPLDQLVCLGPGHHKFEVSVDGKAAGHVQFPVSVVPSQ
jgi:hypothetical protein